MSDQMKHVLIDAYNTTVAQSRDNFWTINVPGLGRLRIVRDWAGLCQSSVILLYWLYGNWSTWNAIILPHYADGNIPLIFILFYAAVSVLCITSFIRASTSNPGSLHLSHVPQDDWTECHMCKHLRPPQSHHCRRCGQCVRRMDHHCPWINNCVGEKNQFAFMQLLLYACMLSISSLAVQAFHFFFFNACISCDKESFVIQHQTSIILVCVVMGVFMTFGAGGLLITQHIGVIYETTTLEWMKIQQEIFMTGNIPEKMPEQTKSCYEVYSTLCGTGFWFLWIFPCRRRHPIFGKFSIV